MSNAQDKIVTEPIVIRSNDPRLYVMISSTTVDLPEHRHEVSEAIQRMGHTPVKMELASAEWNSDAIKFSLEKVEKSQVYLGIFALRYGYIPDDPVRNPHRLSITELEYRHAKKLGIPILLYIAKESHPFTRKQIDFEEEKCKKLDRLKDELSKEIVGFFNDPAELRSLVLQSLHELKIQPHASMSSPLAKPKLTLPAPPALYAVPDYTLTNTFVGRVSELAKLDAWAKSTDPIMVVEGIGGLGKSALTWEWVQQRAASAIPNFAGCVWWSFYEKGTSMVTFVRHALAYVTEQDPESLIKDISHHQRGQQLLAELRKRPFLLVLDGFERVLAAYHRLDKAQLPDDQPVTYDLRACVSPQDGDLLAQLKGCGPSKILVSTRLFPALLEDRASHRPIVGVAHHHLNGLAPADALALMRQAGITGDEKAMLAFANQFGRHSLLLRIVCGLVADYRKKPRNFDAWRADPAYGGSLKLSELDLKQSRNHILKFALDGLDATTRQLLSRIAVISENADYDTLAVLNPFSSSVKFDAALKELEQRGLLYWDRDGNRYEMHPVVRAVAAEALEVSDRAATFDKVRDHFASLPPDDLDTATELSHVTQSLEIYRCLVGAGKLDAAANFYRGDLSRTLLFHLGAYSIMLELLTTLFRGDLGGLPSLASASDQSYILNDLALAYENLGREEDAVDVYGRTLHLDLEARNWNNAATGLRNLRSSYVNLGRRAAGVAALALARDLAEAAGDEDGLTMAIFSQMTDAIDQGRFADAAALDAAFGQRPQLPVNHYRPGDAEYWRCKSQLFQGTLTDAAWQAGYEVAVRHRNVVMQYGFLALRAVWDLGEARPARALEAIDQALTITNRLGTPVPDYHNLRAWALARLGRAADARVELQAGEQRLFAAEAHRALGDVAQARVCALNAYRWAWGEGPPYIEWFRLERSRALLRDLGEPEPTLPPFDPAKVPPIPFEKEIRAAIAELTAKNRE